MRPFKFFFMISIGIMAFFFLAKVFIAAFFFAAIMSLIFFVFRSIKHFFLNMNWQDGQYAYQRKFSDRDNLNDWNQKSESLFNDWENSFSPRQQERIIKL